MSQQNIAVPLGPHKSQVSRACNASAYESIRTSFGFMAELVWKSGAYKAFPERETPSTRHS